MVISVVDRKSKQAHFIACLEPTAEDTARLHRPHLPPPWITPRHSVQQRLAFYRKSLGVFETKTGMETKLLDVIPALWRTIFGICGLLADELGQPVESCRIYLQQCQIRVNRILPVLHELRTRTTQRS